MDCPLCKDWCGPNSEKISRKKASRTAHDLAAKMADKGIEGLEWEEVYALYFPKIYRHEYERNHHLERELELEASIVRNMKNLNVCSYHQETLAWYEDGSHKKTMKETRREYAQSKWPNTGKKY